MTVPPALFYMAFGVLVTTFGFSLAWTARTGTGQTTIKVFGAEISLAAAGGIVVMLMGAVITVVPLLSGRDLLETVPRSDYEGLKGKYTASRSELEATKTALTTLQKHVSDDNLVSFDDLKLAGSVLSVANPPPPDDCAKKVLGALPDDDKKIATTTGNSVYITYANMSALVWCSGPSIAIAIAGSDSEINDEENNGLLNAIRKSFDVTS